MDDLTVQTLTGIYNRLAFSPVLRSPAHLYAFVFARGSLEADLPTDPKSSPIMSKNADQSDHAGET